MYIHNPILNDLIKLNTYIKPYTESRNVHSFIIIKHKYNKALQITAQVRNVIMKEPVFFLQSVGAQLIISGATRPNV